MHFATEEKSTYLSIYIISLISVFETFSVLRRKNIGIDTYIIMNKR